MKSLYTKEEFINAKSKDKLPCECESCKKKFYVFKRIIVNSLNGSKDKCNFCSHKCAKTNFKTKQILSCTNCNKNFEKFPSQIKRSKLNNHFCSNSCAAIYNNTHKTKGNRRSKLEKYLEIELIKLYPNLEILFNNNKAINSELDIYMPSLKLAFELNGIFHYEPIYGKEKLNQIQNNDNRKFQACIEQGIELCLIDASKQKYFKEQSSRDFLLIIIQIINEKF
jgi:hypothetical protein